MYTFDGDNKIISLNLTVSGGEAQYKAIDLYSRWKDWVQLNDNAKYLPAFATVGGEPINQDGSQVISPYFFLTNGWKIRPQDEDHLLVTEGNLLTDDGSNPYLPTTNGSTVLIRTLLSVNSTTTSVTGGVGDSVWTEQEKDSVIDWSKKAGSQRLS